MNTLSHVTSNGHMRPTGPTEERENKICSLFLVAARRPPPTSTGFLTSPPRLCSSAARVLQSGNADTWNSSKERPKYVLVIP
ncbi:hypothetical protein SOVF_176100 [Spinacia oleracea]|nr:hypothetical protein SOVF_176100 [Spinacia oleracea]